MAEVVENNVTMTENLGLKHYVVNTCNVKNKSADQLR